MLFKCILWYRSLSRDSPEGRPNFYGRHRWPSNLYIDPRLHRCTYNTLTFSFCYCSQKIKTLNTANRRHCRFRKRCNVCNKLGCWCTNHAETKRRKALGEDPGLPAFVIDLVSLDNAVGEYIQQQPNVGLELLEEISAHLIDLESVPVQPINDHLSESLSACITQASDANLREIVSDMCDAATLHDPAHTATPPRYHSYSNSQFCGLAIDTGSAPANTCGWNQYTAYCAHVGAGIQSNHHDS